MRNKITLYDPCIHSSSNADITGLVRIGKWCYNYVKNTSYIAYCKPEDVEECKETLKQHNKEMAKHQDSYYSRPWV